MKVYIYGTGEQCCKILDEGLVESNIITGFIETKKTKEKFRGKLVYAVSEIDDYDYVLVSMVDNDEIYNFYEKSGGLEKVIFFNRCKKENGSEKKLCLAKELLTDAGYSKICENYGVEWTQWIEEDAQLYNRLNTNNNFKIDNKYNYYISTDKYRNAGVISGYFWQDLWAARKIVKERPKQHYDIGSRIDGFIAHLLAADINVNLIDVRPLKVSVEKLTFTCADATNLGGIADNSIESLSALCSIEHFGLGRYGDPIDPDACFKCFSSIERKMKSGGSIYISVPVGIEHLEFNAHRVFSTETILKSFPNCELVEFSSAWDTVYEENIDVHKYDNELGKGAGIMGLFYFRKK